MSQNMKRFRIPGHGTFVPCLLHVVSRNVRGIPKDLRLIELDETINLEEMERSGQRLEFEVVLIAEDSLKGNL